MLSLSPTSEGIPHQQANASQDFVKPFQETKEQIKFPSSFIGDRKRSLQNSNDAAISIIKKTRLDDDDDDYEYKVKDER